MYEMSQLLGEIRELMEDDRLFKIFKRTFENYEYYFNTTNHIVLNVYQFNDHGSIHVLLTARRALEILRILKKFGIQTTAEELGKSFEWSKFIVAFGALFHDVGNIIHRENHHLFSTILAEPIIDKLAREFEKTDWLLLKALTLNAIYTHDESTQCTTIEGSCVTVADGCDMEQGRSRLAHKKDKVDIHSVSALAIEKVEIKEGDSRTPIIIDVKMKHLSGIFQVDEILTKKVKNSLLRGKVKIRIHAENQLLEKVV